MGTKIFCKNCGKLNDKSSAFCMQCGKPLPRGVTVVKTLETVSCPKCGLSIPREKRFCNSCGTALNPVPVSPDQGISADPVVDPAKLRTCPHCGIVNYGFRVCFSCGTDLSAATMKAMSPAVAPPDDLSASGRRRLCSSCLGFHPVEDTVAHDGKYYCPECLVNVDT